MKVFLGAHKDFFLRHPACKSFRIQGIEGFPQYMPRAVWLKYGIILWASLRSSEACSTQQVLKARVCAERIERLIHFDIAY